MCVLHHVNDIEKTLKEARRVAKSGGLISIYLPTDPAILYRLLRKIFTFNQSRKLKTDYEHINALTHRNHFFSIINILKHEFKNDVIKIRRRPFILPLNDFNLFNIVHIIIKK